MTASLLYSQQAGALLTEEGQVFEPWFWRWSDAAGPTPDDATPIAPAEALLALAQIRVLRPLPVGVIGPRTATSAQAEAAFAVGAAVARLGLTTMCGGKTGVMAAAAAGARGAGGITIGMLPDSEWQATNDDILIPIATGFREARNVIIARSATALIAIGGSTGTMTEITFGLHFGRLVVALPGTTTLQGVVQAATVEEAIGTLAAHLLSGAAQGPQAQAVP